MRFSGDMIYSKAMQKIKQLFQDPIIHQLDDLELFEISPPILSPTLPKPAAL